MMGDRALVRSVPDSFTEALVTDPGVLLDPVEARRQHDNYVTHLRNAGYSVEQLPPDNDHPDSVFVEDAAVIVGSVAVITRPGAPSRRGETQAVEAALGVHLPLRRIEGEATLDGGDVLRIAHTLYVGRSARTNEEGIDQLRMIADEHGLMVVPLAVEGVLHLKSAVVPVGGETVVVTPGCVDDDLLSDLRVIREDPDERHRFSALPLRNGTVLVSGNALRTASALSVAGFDPVPIDISQMQLADGGLTCLSILY